MKAIVFNRYGGSEVLEMQEIETPVPDDDELLVKVHAVSVNDWDWGLISGKPFVNRLMTGLMKPKKIRIAGSDIAGTITEVGKNISRFKVGDEVFGDLTGRWGGFAQFVCAKEEQLALKPADISFIQAAAVPQAALLAYQGLVDVGNLKPGQKILINGAGGGVGTYGVQIAKQYDVEVTGVDSSDKLKIMKDAGFDHVIDYHREDFTKSTEQYDLILDGKTGRPATAYLRVLKPGGTYVTVGGDMRRLLNVLLAGIWTAPILKKHLRLVSLKPNKDLQYMCELFQSGKLHSIIDGPYDFSESIEALKLFEQAGHKGKIVITL